MLFSEVNPAILNAALAVPGVVGMGAFLKCVGAFNGFKKSDEIENSNTPLSPEPLSDKEFDELFAEQKIKFEEESEKKR